MKIRFSKFALWLLACGSSMTPPAARSAASALLGWNNLGMHCMDSDYSVFSILPPYNTIEAQLIVDGSLVKSGAGYTVTYQAVADPAGSFNSTSAGKGNFYNYAGVLYGANLTPNQGLAGWGMPGTNNIPQAMKFENANSSVTVNWFRAEGIPLTPYDDAGRKNTYPLMRLVVKNASGSVLASSPIVLPVSDEMDCRACHGSGTAGAAQPAEGWVNDSNPERDYRLNILRLHDERRDPATWAGILASNGLNTSGLYAGVVNDQKPILCAKCHLSEALPGTGYGNISPLTQSVHSHHASVIDPTLGVSLNDAANRSACYRCHPGSTTRCLRGVMGSAVASDGSMAMQCQSCHGNMSQVGSSARVGWIMEPNCQSCHTGTATHNNGQLRYTSAFEANGSVRAPVDTTFATSPNTPGSGLSLYRYSSGHGGLQCEACHGSTHAEFPSRNASDNLRNTQLQGHVGVLAECTACHTTMPVAVNGGPHGMHPTGQDWVNQHGNTIEANGVSTGQCATCHGSDNRGTVLSRAQGSRSFVASSEQGTASLQLYRGAYVGCYSCHNGPTGEGINSAASPVASAISMTASAGRAVSATLPGAGGSLLYTLQTQPAHGTAGLNNGVVTYYPDPGFSGTDSFTYSVYNGAKNSALATVTVQTGSAADTQPPSVAVTAPATGTAVATTNVTVTGTASDAGTGNNGIASVAVNGIAATGGTATGAGTAQWSAAVPLQPGENTIVVVATDKLNNAATVQFTVTCSYSTNPWSLWWQGTGGTLAQWGMRGIDRAGASYLNPTQVPAGVKVAGIGEFGGQNGQDLVLQDSSGNVFSWCMDGTNCLRQWQLDPGAVGAGWQVMATGSLQRNRHNDLLVQNTDGRVALWVLNGTNTAQALYLNPAKVDPSWKIAATGDLNRDGSMDVIFRHRDGWIAVWVMNGTNRVSGGFLNPPKVDPSWHIVGTADFNQDGQTELIWQHDTGLLSYWLMNGTNRIGGGNLGPGKVAPSWRIVGPK
jgi:hypothetical protein